MYLRIRIRAVRFCLRIVYALFTTAGLPFHGGQGPEESASKLLADTKMSMGHILVVDDEPQIRRVMRTTLVSQGYEVSDARTGDDALDLIRGEKYDLVLLDVNMPGISGLETCREIRLGSDLPIIMLTVRDAERDKVQALDAGADGYLTKPFSVSELLARIRAVLRRTSFPAGIEKKQLKLGDIEIDFETRRITSEGKQLRLTTKEFDLLSYLAVHANKTITHRELLKEVWGPDYGGEQEYLRVFVNRLRKKIEASPSEPKYLLTEPWVGYRLELPD
jgi:two-component system, OmpR family, KDP operon response regulator KdpE